jgi:peptide/nickel transport system ATP-binding protein/oligopeptide transport system ATP-binding protein
LQRAAIGPPPPLAVSPALIMADEAVSKFDVSLREQIVNLLKRGHAERGPSLLPFITRDLHVARFPSDRSGVRGSARGPGRAP